MNTVVVIIIVVVVIIIIASNRKLVENVEVLIIRLEYVLTSPAFIVMRLVTNLLHAK